MNFFKKNKKRPQKQIDWKIKSSCLDLIIESAKSVYPNEFGALLRIDDKQKSIISEIILLPGTIQGDSHTIFKLHMMPVDFNIVGRSPIKTSSLSISLPSIMGVISTDRGIE